MEFKGKNPNPFFGGGLEEMVTQEKGKEISMGDLKTLKSFLEEKKYSFEIDKFIKYIKVSFETKATVRNIFQELLGDKFKENNLVDGDGEIIYYFNEKHIPEKDVDV